MNGQQASQDGHTLAERYESLRAAVLACPERRGPGLASVCTQGLWAWVELVRVEHNRPRGQAAPSRPRTPPPASQAELVDVWVQLALAHAVEAR